MIPHARSLSRIACAALSLCLVASAAFAQAPSAKPAATAAPTAKPAATVAPTASANAAPSASASAAPSASASASAGLPPGHPPTGDLPPGHPPTGSPDGDPDESPPAGGAANPHGANPHGGGSGARGQLFDAPPDTAEDDITLPPGTIVLMLRDAQERPIPSADVTLGIVHNTVATGESRERKTGTTDAEGTIRWEGMPRGSGTSFRASVVNDRATFGTDPFALGDRAGKRVVLHVYKATSNIEETLIGMQGIVYLSLREDSINVESLYGIFNLGSVAWVPENFTLELPEGYKAFNRPDAMDGVGVDEVNGKGVLRGTIGPGRHEVQFHFQVPLDQSERQTIKLALPPHVAQMRVMVEASKTMGVEVPGFNPARKSKNRDGKRVLVTEKMMGRDQGGLESVSITLTGLPTGGNGRWVAAGLSVVALIFAGMYVQQRRQQTGPDEETRGDLIDAREALLSEILELERAHRTGEIGDKSYTRLRNALLDALERLTTKIAEATKKRGASRVADEAET